MTKNQNQNAIQNDSNDSMHPALASKKLTIRDLEQVAGGLMAVKSKVSDGGYTSESDG